MKVKRGQRGTLKTDDFVRGMRLLEEVLNALVRRLKKKIADTEAANDG
jgi:hypothetical protein